MLNKGRSHGIDKDMGVITANGIVGTVVDVSENFSRVMSILHENNKINARIKKNNHIGNVEWGGNYYTQGLLTDIPTHVNLYSGDTIITSGNSFIFPEGILVGTVDKHIIDKGDKFNKARINFSVDYNNLYFVYVIVNLMKEEQVNLQAKGNLNEQ
jgi:rod shape-determining protein MreC